MLPTPTVSVTPQVRRSPRVGVTAGVHPSPKWRTGRHQCLPEPPGPPPRRRSPSRNRTQTQSPTWYLYTCNSNTRKSLAAGVTSVRFRSSQSRNTNQYTMNSLRATDVTLGVWSVDPLSPSILPRSRCRDPPPGLSVNDVSEPRAYSVNHLLFHEGDELPNRCKQCLYQGVETLPSQVTQVRGLRGWRAPLLLLLHFGSVDPSVKTCTKWYVTRVRSPDTPGANNSRNLTKYVTVHRSSRHT